MKATEIQAAAEQLYQAERNCHQVRALSISNPSMDMDDAYAIQKAWVDRKIGEGRKVTGYKIGLTSRAMQLAMGIDSPDFGVLLSDMQIENGGEIRAARFPDPRIEAEFAFLMKKPLQGDNVTLDEVLDATDYVVPALELIAARSYRVDPETGYKRNVLDTIADNAANAGYILGDHRIDPERVDLRWAGAMLKLNGEVEETGLAGGVMGHPAHGIRWVCRRFSSYGVGLEPGQIVLAGSFTRPVVLRPGDKVSADYGPFGTIEATVT